jgi:hypothetical protein
MDAVPSAAVAGETIASGKNGDPISQNGNHPGRPAASPSISPWNHTNMSNGTPIAITYLIYRISRRDKTMAFVISNCKSRIDLLRRFAISCILTAHRRPTTQRTDASNMSGGSTLTQATFPKEDLVRTDAMRMTTRRLTTPKLSYYAIQRQLATQPDIVLTTDSGIVKLLKRYGPDYTNECGKSTAAAG